ncbi:hypothetical protein [Burkholderia sola]
MSKGSSLSATLADNQETVATLQAAAENFGAAFELAEELEAFLETSAALAGKDQLDPAQAFLFARTGARLAHALMVDLDAAFQRFALEADRYGVASGQFSVGSPRETT